jgi:hypothetical protein
MDEQNPRLGGEYVSGRTDERTRGLDPAETSGRPASRPAGSSSYVTTTPAIATADRATTPEPRTRELRAEIEQTREGLSETVNAIQERLRPGNIAADAKEKVKAVARERARDVTESEPVQYVRANPIATTMIGIGIAGVAMLAFGGRDHRSYGRARRNRDDWRTASRGDGPYAAADSRYEANLYPAGAAGDEYAPGASRGAYDETGRGYGVRSRAYGEDEDGPDDGSSWRVRRDQSSQYLQRTWHEHALVIGAASAVVGALVGLAVPESEREHQLMGEARDSVVETVQESVRDKVNQVQQAATDAVNTVKEAAGSAVGVVEDASGQRRG